jgi:hypothetical protein
MNIFSNSPKTRLDEAKNFRKTFLDEKAYFEYVKQYLPDWKEYWFGSINPWIVFLGISPGGSPGEEINWQRDAYPTCGEPNLHFKGYLDGRGFWNIIRDWSFTMLEGYIKDKDDCYSLSLLGNIVEKMEGNSSKITLSEVEGEVQQTIANLEKLKPKIILTLQKEVQEVLVKSLKKEGANILSEEVRKVKANTSSYDYYNPVIYQYDRQI